MTRSQEINIFFKYNIRIFIFTISTILIFNSCSNKRAKIDNPKLKTDTIIIQQIDTVEIIVRKSNKRISKQQDNTNTLEDIVENKAPKDAQSFLQSWNDNKTKKQIIDYINKISDQSNSHYIPPKDRVATFDLDGTLWPEKPSYFQILFVFDRINELAKDNPKLKKDKLVKAVLQNDIETIRKYGAAGLGSLMSIAQSGITTDEFNKIVLDWYLLARHPKTNIQYTKMIYQPMIEMITFLKEYGFDVYLVSGGGIDFMRPLAEVLNIKTSNIIGSRQKLEYKYINGEPVLMKKPEVNFTCNNTNKVIAIYQIIGKVPTIAFGNSDEDIPTFEWVNNKNGMSVLIHHTDSIREWKYDKKSPTGTLNKGIIKAKDNNWVIVDMAKDWNIIYK